ncbi:hypothetical protein [Streptomyces sp. NBC_01497]|uniref:hypothetical protein n=1 Tax=Streptomyces sp. NBC_01497 TaxID=2903885 RepID=UPI002E31F899|nr:hypothetical protein [Streptomyces sp. NBC_01497]
MSPTEPVARASSAPPLAPRSVSGTLWRCAATLLVSCAAVGAAAALDARLHIDGATASLPTTVVALLAAVLVGAWLRAGQAWLFATLAGADVCGLSTANLLARGLLRGGHPHPAVLTGNVWSETLAASAAIALAVLVVCVVGGGVRGHRHPASLPHDDTKDMKNPRA